MVIHTFRCETCPFSMETVDTKTPHYCPKCEERLYWDLKDGNIGREGDFKKFFSPDLGVQIDSSKQLKDVLKKRGMVCLTDSKEKREYDRDMLGRAREGEFDNANN